MKQQTLLPTAKIWAAGEGTVPVEIVGPPEMVLVAGGTFQMGGYVSEGEEPVHRVTVSTYCIGKYPVTVQQYRAFCAATGRRMPGGHNSWDCSEHAPVVSVTFDDAASYCKWLCVTHGGNWRLPHEAEWEYAARGGSQSMGYTYSGSNDLSAVGWFGGNSSGCAIGTGLKQANELGIYDMSGNVWEWCQDWYGADYYAVSAVLNPKGPALGTHRVLRGGAWDEIPITCRVAHRSHRVPEECGDNSGFRVALSP